jgi:hypothetical protein
MFVSSDLQCSFDPSSQIAIVPGELAACLSSEAATNYQMAQSAAGWQNLIQRTWPSFADQGVHVAFQLRNGGPSQSNGGAVVAGPGGVVAGSGGGGSPPRGVDMGGGSGGGINLVGSPGSANGNPAGAGFGPNGQNGVPGSNGGRQQRRKAMTPADQSGAAIVQYFGYRPEYKTYTGPLPATGTVKSLVIGGSNRPAAVGPGAPAANPFGLTPGAYVAGGGACSLPGGIAMLPSGEPDYAALAAASGGSSTSGGMGLLLVGLVVLAGLGFMMEQGPEKRTTRKRKAK